MQYQFYQTSPVQTQPDYSNRSVTMEHHSVVLGIIAIVSCLSICIIPWSMFVAMICSSLAILFASLSRGGEMAYSNKAKLGLGLGLGSLSLTIFIIAISICCVAFIYYTFGGAQEFLQWYCNMYHLDYNTYFGDLNFEALDQLMK